MTWNPARWPWPDDDLAAAVDATAMGQVIQGRWSTGRRTKGVMDGDRAFLLRQGAEPRGIVASGTFLDGVFQAEHWDGSGRLANYAEIDFGAILDPTDMLPLVDLKAALPHHDWEPQSSGTVIPPAMATVLENLWAQHVVTATPKTGGQARQRDTERRKKIEDAAQDRLMRHYRDEGWIVEDTRIGNPFDARAAKDGAVLYLEAKGTMSVGSTVIVTRNEVAWARGHAGECVIGIWSGVRFGANGEIDPASGRFRIFEWLPANDDLVPIDFDWATGGTRIHP